MAGIYKNEEGRAAVLALYDRGLAQLAIRAESRSVETRFGRTHLLSAGPAQAPPLVVVHGANGSAVAMAAAFGSLSERFRCHFLDVPGEPNRSSEVRLSKADDSLTRWLEDVLAALQLEHPALLGMSGGGFVVLKLATERPERARELIPDLRDVIAIPHAGHVHPDLVGPAVLARIAAFLEA